jgi:hypothetical protein
MATYCHILNPVNVSEKSDLHVAQPITFASVQKALEYSRGKVEVEVLTTQYPEDRAVIPEFCRVLPDLERSVLDTGRFSKPRKLPLIGDILLRAWQHSSADYVIYTNMDIGLLPHVYELTDFHIRAGAASLCINRRRLQKIYTKVEELPLMYADYGRAHPGYDYFVFRRELIPQMVLGNICLGIPFIEIGLIHNMMALAGELKVLEHEHATFHIGLEVLPPVNPEYYWHNRNEFEKKVFPALRDRIDARRYPHYLQPLWKRMLKYGLNPAFRFHIAAEMEGQDLKRRWIFYLQELRFSLLEKLK